MTGWTFLALMVCGVCSFFVGWSVGFARGYNSGWENAEHYVKEKGE